MVKKTNLALLLAALSVLAVGIAACTSPGDDDDDTSGDLSNCQIVWANQGSTSPVRYDVYLVDMPIEDWISGPQTYDGGDHVAVFYDELLLSSDLYVARAITTAGSFSITATQGTAQGEPVTLTDDGSQLLFDYGNDEETGALVASGGFATFTGQWSDPTGVLPVSPGTSDSRVTFRVVAGSSQTIGFYTRYAICYDAQSTAASRREPATDRAYRALKSVLR